MSNHAHMLTAREAGVVACTSCARVWPTGRSRCGRCNAKLTSRDATSLSRVWAWWFAGVLFYIPANTLPMLSTKSLLSTSEDTILGGAITLMEHGSIGIAVIILVASILIPVAKFASIAFLAISARRNTDVSAHSRHALFELVEYIGRWSMIDVFVVAILSSLVQLNVAATITPGIAAFSFALSVIFTMLSAQAFDSRMIWDRIDPAKDAAATNSGKSEVSA